MMEDSNTTTIGLNESDSNQTLVGSPRPTSVQSYILLSLVTVPGVVCNSVALFFIVRDVRKAVFPAIILLLALCCADLLAISLTAVRHVLVYLVTEMTYGLCAPLSIINTFFRLYAGILNVMMAVDRVMALGVPFYYKRNVDVKRWRIGCIAAAVVTAMFTLLPVVGLGDVMITTVTNGRQRVTCSTFYYHEEPIRRVYGYLYAVVGLTITLTIATGNLVVVRIILKLKNIVNVSPMETSSSNAETDKPSTSNQTSFEIAFAKLMGGLAIVYLVTGVPYYTLILLQQLDMPIARTTTSIIHLLAGLSFTFDPIVYILIRKISRKRIMNFLFRCCTHEV